MITRRTAVYANLLGSFALNVPAPHNQDMKWHYTAVWAQFRTSTQPEVCRHQRIVRQGTELMKLEDAYSQREAFRKRVRDSPLMANMMNTEVLVVPPNKAALLYSYTREFAGFRCSATRYGAILASSMAEALTEFEDAKAACPRLCTGYEIVERRSPTGG
jgi:hypothetical protein